MFEIRLRRRLGTILKDIEIRSFSWELPNRFFASKALDFLYNLGCDYVEWYQFQKHPFRLYLPNEIKKCCLEEFKVREPQEIANFLCNRKKTRYWIVSESAFFIKTNVEDIIFGRISDNLDLLSKVASNAVDQSTKDKAAHYWNLQADREVEKCLESSDDIVLANGFLKLIDKRLLHKISDYEVIENIDKMIEEGNSSYHRGVFQEWRTEKIIDSLQSSDQSELAEGFLKFADKRFLQKITDSKIIERLDKVMEECSLEEQIKIYKEWKEERNVP